MEAISQLHPVAQVAVVIFLGLAVIVLLLRL